MLKKIKNFKIKNFKAKYFCGIMGVLFGWLMIFNLIRHDLVNAQFSLMGAWLSLLTMDSHSHK